MLSLNVNFYLLPNTDSKKASIAFEKNIAKKLLFLNHLYCSCKIIIIIITYVRVGQNSTSNEAL